jgi:hypothetical protein
MIVRSEQEEAAQSLIEAMRSHLSGLEVSVVVVVVDQVAPDYQTQLETAKTVVDEHGALAAIWCDLATGQRCLLYAPDQGDGRVLIRDLDEASQEGRAEAVAVIVRTSLDELLLLGERETSAQVEQTPASDGQLAVEDSADFEAAQARRLLEVSTAYAFYVHSTSHPAIHGLDIGLGLRIAGGLAAKAGYTLLGPIEENGETANLRVTRHPIRAGLEYRFAWHALALNLGAALTIDVVSFKNTGLHPDLAPDTDDNDLLLSVLPTIGVSRRLVGGLTVFCLVGAEISLTSLKYVTELSGEQEELVRAWPVQPWFWAGLALELL